jgi:hypothetical protein
VGQNQRRLWLFGKGNRCLGMTSKFFGKGIAFTGFENRFDSAEIRQWGWPAGQCFHGGKRQGMKPRTVARKLKLIRGIAQERMPEEIGLLSVQWPSRFLARFHSCCG